MLQAGLMLVQPLLKDHGVACKGLSGTIRALFFELVTAYSSISLNRHLLLYFHADAVWQVASEGVLVYCL